MADKILHFLNGGGEMGTLTRGHDWKNSSLGKPETWPQSLRLTVSMILKSKFPMFLWWGNELIQFYNDAYRPSLGNNGKHPLALGQKGKECWPEIWTTIGPLIDQVRETGEATWSEDQLLPIFRNGKLEDVYWTFGYSPIEGESGSTDGVLVVCTETTGKIQTLNELKDSSNRLAESEANLRNIFLQAPVAMCLFKGPDFILELANERMFQLWGKSAEELLGNPIFEALHEASNQGFEQLLTEVYTTGETFKAEGVPITLPLDKTLKTIYVNFVYEAMRGGDGTITGVMAVAIDVSQQENTRHKIEESENRVSALVKSSPFPIGVYIGREMRIAMANQSILDVWGKGNDVIGKTYYELLPELDNQQIYPLLDKVFTSGEAFHARNQRVDIVVEGKLSPFYFNYSFTPLFDRDGNVYGVMNTAAEVSDLVEAKQQVEQSERNFRNIVKQAPVAMCIMLGPEHIVDVANDLIIELWGKPKEEVLNKPIFVGLPDARGQGLEELLKSVYETGASFTANERPVTLIRKGKSETIYQNFVYDPYRDPDGTILGVLAITLDVTAQVIARQNIEEVVKERTESLRKSNAELSQFAYISSHDLQEPARKVSTFVEMLSSSLGDSIDPRSKTYLEKIEIASSRMLTLIRDILAISQLSKATYQFESVNLEKVLQETLEDFELLIAQRNCTIKHDTLPELEAIPVQMNQLFSNLISNSLKFLKKDEESFIEIKCRKLQHDEMNSMNLKSSSSYYKLEFIDNGIGFEQSHADQIFDIFQRLHPKSEYQGTGIGLSMCKKIADNHEGLIYAKSALNEGATFTVILPATHDVTSK